MNNPVWNQRHLPCPPTITVKYTREYLEETIKTNFEELFLKNHTFKSLKDNRILVSTEEWLTNFTSHLITLEKNLESTEKGFNYEISFLFAYIYQRGDLRKEKLMQSLKKVKKCLKRWTEVNLKKLVNNLLQMIPREFFYIQKIRLPSPKYFHYVLHRLVGSFFLLSQCISYCMETSIYLRSKLLHGHFIGYCTLGYAIMGRIRSYALDIMGSIAKANDALHPYIMSLVKSSGMNKNNELPCNLLVELKKTVSKISEDEEKSSSMDNSEEKEDLGEYVAYSKFEALKVLSEGVIGSPKTSSNLQ